MWRQVVSWGIRRACGWCALAYAAAAALGIAFTREAGPIAVFWPANALLLGLSLRMPPRDYPVSLAACMLAAVAVNLGYSDAPGIAATRAAVNILEVLCGYQLIARFSPSFTLTDLRSLFVLAVASMTAPRSAPPPPRPAGEPSASPSLTCGGPGGAATRSPCCCSFPCRPFDPKPLNGCCWAAGQRGCSPRRPSWRIAFALLFVVSA